MTKATRKSFNRGWVFQLDDSAAFAAPTLDDRAWRGVTLPHDWSAEEPLDEANPAGCGGGYAKAGIGWYRKHFDFTPEMAGKVVRITFDGVYMDTDIYLNEQRIGGCGYGYSSFYVDLSPALRDGDNVLAVRVNNSLQPNSRWYAGSGIYRNVWLEILENVHLAQWGIFAMTSQLYLDRQPTLAKLQINTNVDNDTDVRLHAEVFHTLQDANGKELFSTGTAIQLDMHTSGEVMTTPVVESPHLWTCDDPYLYTLHTVVRVNGAIVDAAQTRIGIRTATFDCDQGFLLSGKPVKIKGMCVHHDCGLTGAVGLRESWLRRLRLLKDMGCNGIRCAHNPPTPELLDLCDELGFFVMDEIFDEWMLTKDKIHNYYSQSLAYGSSQFFCRDAQKDLLTMLQRDRCHPSIVLWSIGNEIPEQATVEGVRLLHYLQDICHREDPTRMVISACDNIAAAAPSTAFCEFVNALDVVGYNYVARWRERAETLYDEDHKHFPQRRMIGSENPSAGGARGDYALQTGSASAFRNDYLRATMNHEFLWRYTMSRDFVAGDFLWTGIDYLGESEWPSKGSASGPIDTAGFPKDTFYYFRSLWNEKDTTLHLLPHWNWQGQEGQFKQVVCYTNCEYVKLYLNGCLVGTKGYDCPNVGALKAWNDRAKWTNPTTHDLHLVWDLPYEAGELKAEGYINDKLIATKLLCTTGKPVCLKAVADCTELLADGVAHIELSALDSQGRAVPDANFPVCCALTGAGSFMGMDNGNMLDLTVWSSPKRNMYHGLLLVMVRAQGCGNLTATFSAEGMADLSVSFCVKEIL